MSGIKQSCSCPICGRVFETNPKTCVCGFEGIVFLPDDCISPELCEAYEGQRRELSFSIFKFAKQVYCKERPYKKSELVIIEHNDYFSVEEAIESRGIAYVEPEIASGDVRRAIIPRIAADGMLVMRSNVKALILNTNEARCSMLDESQVETLILGNRFVRFTDGGLLQHSSLKYIWVDGKNPRFTASDNVLYSSSRDRLFIYPRLKQDAEFWVPKTVKSLEPYSFFMPKYLKRLFLPFGIKIHKDAFGRKNAVIRTGSITKELRPEMEIIYY